MTYQHRRIVKSIDEESLLGLTRKQRVERDPLFRQGGSRFPAFDDGRPSIGFATLSHSSLRTWSDLRGADKHNGRAIGGPNIRADGPAPIELIEGATGTYEERARATLDAHGVSHKVRKGGTLATEDVYSASPEYWNRDGNWRDKPIDEIINDPLIARIIAFARKRHGDSLVSISLHLDEQTPHVHVVALPLVKRLHYKRGRKPKGCEIGSDGRPIDPRPPVEKWSLDWSTLRGNTSKMEKAHDDWAAAVADLDLARGSKGSELSPEELRTRKQMRTGRASEGGKRIREERERILFEAEVESARIIDAAANEVRIAWSEIVEERLKLDADRAALDARTVKLDSREAHLRLEAHEAQSRADKLDQREALQLTRETLNRRQSDLLYEADLRWQAKDAALAKRQENLDLRSASIAAADKSLGARERDLEAGIRELDEEKATLAADLEEIAARKQKAEETETSLKARNAENQRLREGLNQRYVELENEVAQQESQKRKLARAAKALAEAAQFLGEAAKPGGDKLICCRDGRVFPLIEGAVPRWWDALGQDLQPAVETNLRRIVGLGVTVRQIASTRLKAAEFESAWSTIPEAQRLPSVRQAEQLAQEVKNADWPPGFAPPGQGGFSR